MPRGHPGPTGKPPASDNKPGEKRKLKPELGTWRRDCSLSRLIQFPPVMRRLMGAPILELVNTMARRCSTKCSTKRTRTTVATINGPLAFAAAFHCMLALAGVSTSAKLSP
jgi:hypothetical protein